MPARSTAKRMRGPSLLRLLRKARRAASLGGCARREKAIHDDETVRFSGLTGQSFGSPARAGQGEIRTIRCRRMGDISIHPYRGKRVAAAGRVLTARRKVSICLGRRIDGRMSNIADLFRDGAANAWLFAPTAVALGALHGLEPGHSKTMMAAFIVAVRGTVATGGAARPLGDDLAYGDRLDRCARRALFRLALERRGERALSADRLGRADPRRRRPG